MFKETVPANRISSCSIMIMVGVILIFFHVPSLNAQTFLDVPTDHWAYSFIEEFAGRGITAGCGGGNYCPDAAVSRAQMAVFVVRAMQRPVVIDGNDEEIGIFVMNSNGGGGTEMVDFLTEEGFYVRELVMATGELLDKGLLYSSENCVGTPYTYLHAGSVFRSGLESYYVDKSSIALSDFSYASSYNRFGGCANFSGVAEFVWPALPNNASVTGFVNQAYQMPISIDVR